MNIIPFQFESNPVRVVTDDRGEPWFNAKEICDVLGYGNHRQAVDTHVDMDDVQKLDAIDNMGRKQLANHINESGLYALIFGSTKDEAKRFKRWVTHDVLPSIRKTGGYSAKPSRPHSISRNQVAASILLLRSAAEDLKLAPSAVLGGYQKLEEKLGVTGLLPAYAVDDGGAGGGSSRSTNSATWLLKQHGAKISASKFNEAAMQLGFLEEKSRNSSKVDGGIKKFKSITSAGLAYGKNATNPANQKETQPLWFEDSFADLLDLVTNMIENAKNEELDAKKENHDK